MGNRTHTHMSFIAITAIKLGICCEPGTEFLSKSYGQCCITSYHIFILPSGLCWLMVCCTLAFKGVSNRVNISCISPGHTYFKFPSFIAAAIVPQFQFSSYCADVCTHYFCSTSLTSYGINAIIHVCERNDIISPKHLSNAAISLFRIM